MESLFEPATAAGVRARIASLRPGSERQWGIMTVSQMLAHCSAWMELASGMTSPPQSLLGRIFGKMAKRSILGDKPIRRNMPTDRSLMTQGEKDFPAEQHRLIDLVDKFATGGPDSCTTHPHSFFGTMTPGEWAILGYKHLDHHLKQFGA